jgi:branched-chain amino acid transport system permease protein
MDTVAQQIVNALTIGSMYTLVGVGFTLFFGVMGLINFAHGEVYMLGAFTGLVIFWATGGTLPTAVVVVLMFIGAMAFCGGLGVAIERVAFRPLRRMPVLIVLITSLAVSIIVREGLKEFFPNGANPQRYLTPFGLTVLRIGPVIVTYEALILMGLTAGLIATLYLLVSRTWLGRSMRATAEDREAAMMMGVDVDRTVRQAFFIGSALGACAGVMNGLNYGSVKFDMGWTASIKGFTSAVIGGLGNIYGAMVGGFVLGFLEVFVVDLVPKGGQYKDVITFVILILTLVFRPSGLLGPAAGRRAG